MLSFLVVFFFQLVKYYAIVRSWFFSITKVFWYCLFFDHFSSMLFAAFCLPSITQVFYNCLLLVFYAKIFCCCLFHPLKYFVIVFSGERYAISILPGTIAITREKGGGL